MTKDEILQFNVIIYVLAESEPKKILMQEMHNVPYARHPGYQKTLTTTKKEFYSSGMKKEVAMYIARYLECQKVKAERKHPAGLLHPLLILEWKWDVVTIDFITRIPRTQNQHDSIMEVVIN